MLPIKRTALQKLETFANISRIQTDEETYDLEHSVVGSMAAGATADRCGQRGAGNRAVVSVDVGDGEVDNVAMTLLERWDAHPPHFSQLCEVNEDEIRRELAIDAALAKENGNA